MYRHQNAAQTHNKRQACIINPSEIGKVPAFMNCSNGSKLVCIHEEIKNMLYTGNASVLTTGIYKVQLCCIMKVLSV
jgi:hypothetical protein